LIGSHSSPSDRLLWSFTIKTLEQHTIIFEVDGHIKIEMILSSQ
jgi:hypothetical protein